MSSRRQHLGLAWGAVAAALTRRKAGPSPVKTWSTKWFNRWATAERQRLFEEWCNNRLVTVDMGSDDNSESDEE